MPLSPIAALDGVWLRISSVALPGSLTGGWTVMSVASWARTWFTAVGVAGLDGLPVAAAPGAAAGAEGTTRATAATAAAAPRATAPRPTVRRDCKNKHHKEQPEENLH